MHVRVCQNISIVGSHLALLVLEGGNPDQWTWLTKETGLQINTLPHKPVDLLHV